MSSLQPFTNIKHRNIRSNITYKLPLKERVVRFINQLQLFNRDMLAILFRCLHLFFCNYYFFFVLLSNARFRRETSKSSNQNETREFVFMTRNEWAVVYYIRTSWENRFRADANNVAHYEIANRHILLRGFDVSQCLLYLISKTGGSLSGRVTGSVDLVLKQQTSVLTYWSAPLHTPHHIDKCQVI